MTVGARRNPAMRVTWLDDGRRPQYLANPLYPNGVDVDCSGGAKITCTQALPYPANGCGQYFLVCDTCRRTILISATGRADDPRSVKVACKVEGLA
jgi:hypothetical protein